MVGMQGPTILSQNLCHSYFHPHPPGRPRPLLTQRGSRWGAPHQACAWTAEAVGERGGVGAGCGVHTVQRGAGPWPQWSLETISPRWPWG